MWKFQFEETSFRTFLHVGPDETFHAGPWRYDLLRIFSRFSRLCRTRKLLREKFQLIGLIYLFVMPVL